MKRRQVLLSGAVLALSSFRSAGAQTGNLFLPTQRKVAEFLTDENAFRSVLLGVNALRLNLILGSYSGRGEDSHVMAAATASYEEMEAKAFDGFRKLQGSLDRNSDEPMKELEPALQQPVQRSIEVLGKFGLSPDSELASKQATAFWTFLYVLTEGGVATTESVRDWLCGSSPFDLLCS